MPLPRNPQRAMHLRELGFFEDPFSDFPDSHFFCPTQQHGLVLDNLMALIERGQGLAVIDGQEGLGKSILARRLESYYRCRSYGYRVVYLSENLPSIDSEFLILAAISDALNLSRRKGVESQSEAIWSHVRHQAELGLMTVLILDSEAGLSKEALAPLSRMGQELCPTIIFGTRELAVNLGKLPDAVKSSYRNTLTPFTLSAASEMIQFRCAVAQQPIHLFSTDALSYLWDLGHGSPRDLVNVCAASLDSVTDLRGLPLSLGSVRSIANLLSRADPTS